MTMKTRESNETIQKIYYIGREDLSHLIPHKQSADDTKEYLDDISIDSNNILSSCWKERFFSICKKFSNTRTPSLENIMAIMATLFF